MNITRFPILAQILILAKLYLASLRYQNLQELSMISAFKRRKGNLSKSLPKVLLLALVLVSVLLSCETGPKKDAKTVGCENSCIKAKNICILNAKDGSAIEECNKIMMDCSKNCRQESTQ